ncbi:MAG: hypothetical protein A2Y12_01270 [Planctomycetes bacterium GWF2_42_9]|nr:MAG: hypothetical protein A2Y12_01270 [Planctomycetes bacterium GWF2_42_9]HAL44810.1 hypothetical protein [Phycisphaerales bacterium]
MSVNAYKVIIIKTADRPTFNCWSDFDLIQEFAVNSQSISDNGGFIEIDINEVKEALQLREFEPEDRDTLNQIVIDANGEEYVTYKCY